VSVATDQELRELRTALRDLLESRCDEKALRSAIATPNATDVDLWQFLSSQLGVQAIGIPEQMGGAGGGLAELRVVCEELGRALAPIPFLSTNVLAATAITASADEDAQVRYLPPIADGQLIAALAAVEHDGSWDDQHWTTHAVKSDAGWRITGTKSLVIDGCIADLLLVAARTDVGLSLFAVDASAPGIVRHQMTSLDLTRSFARIDFTDAPARPLGAAGRGREILDSMLTTARVLVAAEQVGAADRCLEMSVDYAKTRVQFGRPIGKFQAIKHLCADMLIELEGARAAVDEAIEARRQQRSDAPLVAVVASTESARALYFVARENIHIHGGIAKGEGTSCNGRHEPAGPGLPAISRVGKS